MRSIILCLIFSSLYAAIPPEFCEKKLLENHKVSVLKTIGSQKGLSLLIKNIFNLNKTHEVLGVETGFEGQFLIDVIRNEFTQQMFDFQKKDIDYLHFLYEKYRELKSKNCLSSNLKALDEELKILIQPNQFRTDNQIEKILAFLYIENRFDEFHDFYDLLMSENHFVDLSEINRLALKVGQAEFFYHNIQVGALSDYLQYNIGDFLVRNPKEFMKYLKSLEETGKEVKHYLIGEILSQMVMDRNYYALLNLFYRFNFPVNDLYHFSHARESGLNLNIFDKNTLADFASAHIQYLDEEIQYASTKDLPEIKELLPIYERKRGELQSILTLIQSFNGRRKINIIPTQNEIQLLSNEVLDYVFLRFDYVFNYLIRGEKWELLFSILRKQTNWQENKKPHPQKFNSFILFLNQHGTTKAAIELLKQINPYFKLISLPDIFYQNIFHQELDKEDLLTRELFFVHLFNEKNMTKLLHT